MQTRKVSLPNGKDCELRIWKTVVLSVSRDQETHVYGGGGGGRIAVGGGTINEVSIRSKVVENYRVWIRYLIGNRERELNFGGWGLTCREGHELTLVAAGLQNAKERFEIIAVNNGATHSTHFVPDIVQTMRDLNFIDRPLKLEWITFLLLWAGLFLIFVFLSDIPSLKSSWILMTLAWLGVVPILPAFIGGVVRRRCRAAWIKSAGIVERALKSEIGYATDAMERS